MPKCDKYHAKWKANMAKCSKHHAKCKVTMPKRSKYHAKWQVLVQNCCKHKANGTGKENQTKIPKTWGKKNPKTILHPLCVRGMAKPWNKVGNQLQATKQVAEMMVGCCGEVRRMKKNVCATHRIMRQWFSRGNVRAVYRVCFSLRKDDMQPTVSPLVSHWGSVLWVFCAMSLRCIFATWLLEWEH